MSRPRRRLSTRGKEDDGDVGILGSLLAGLGFSDKPDPEHDIAENEPMGPYERTLPPPPPHKQPPPAARYGVAAGKPIKPHDRRGGFEMVWDQNIDIDCYHRADGRFYCSKCDTPNVHMVGVGCVSDTSGVVSWEVPK